MCLRSYLLQSAHKHARQTLDIPPHQIGDPRDARPGGGVGGWPPTARRAGEQGLGASIAQTNSIHIRELGSKGRTPLARELPDLPPTAGLSQAQRLLIGRQRLIRVAQLDI